MSFLPGLNRARSGPWIAAVLAMLAASPAARSELPSVKPEVAFPNLRFDRPVAIDFPRDGSNRLFVVEQHQDKIWSFPNDPGTSEKVLFLELPDPISRDNEEGLLGLAFHPKYKENGQIFVYYSANEGPTGRRSVVSRFRVNPMNPREALPGSEERIWMSEPDPFGNHNGGHIAFGPDGFLYITLGDSGAADDPLQSGQDPSDFWGSILRIDVDHPAGSKPYGIPKDNPRLRDPNVFAKWAPEVFAIGLRNVWKFSFDRETGTLWAGDVGQNLWEEVDIITNGGNYGWSVREGLHGFARKQKVPVKRSELIEPIFDYPHAPSADRADDGKSITGGFVYRGQGVPALQGVYVFGDFDTGRIWGLRESGGKLTEVREIVDLKSNPKLAIASFGEDARGELYILAFDGRIYRFAAAK
jgi:glucose/arabinose dehydrogenase